MWLSLVIAMFIIGQDEVEKYLYVQVEKEEVESEEWLTKSEWVDREKGEKECI